MNKAIGHVLSSFCLVDSTQSLIHIVILGTCANANSVLAGAPSSFLKLFLHFKYVLDKGVLSPQIAFLAPFRHSYPKRLEAAYSRLAWLQPMSSNLSSLFMRIIIHSNFQLKKHLGGDHRGAYAYYKTRIL